MKPFPEYKEPTNEERAERARQAILAHAALTFEDGGTNEPMEDLISDLLTDLRHLCDEEETDYADCDRRGQNHYTYEVVEARNAKVK